MVSCQSEIQNAQQETVSEELIINYRGEGDISQFKMFQGLQQVLSKDSINGYFEGSVMIPNLNEAIFTYDIVVHKTDESGRMIELEPKVELIQLNNEEAIEQNGKYLWVGKNRSNSFLKNEELSGSVATKLMTSEFIAEREITVYTPKDLADDIPHIYIVDGSSVNGYAPYVDHLISTNRIIPIKLIGIHSSSIARYEEYVKGGDDNELFTNHEKFVFKEVINAQEKEIENWKGKRYMYGFSNGAAFSMYSGLNHPDLFEEIIAFSTADYISPFAQMMNPIKFKFAQYPTFYLGAGKYETSIYDDNLRFLKKMKDNNLNFEFKEFIAGHDYNVWRIEFLQYIENRFKKQEAKD